ncbi:uncharacterized protein LOC105435523 [Cucumis sativus]|uniref:DUF761 domain-containing protein n=1 Tax=Cucumis sativus TaxID=3659 RepID=A0A0A0KP26_CUCSA|nr:uncharacterized protein LOC105435523 [Cucumis sativus]KGN51368.1 hypothetical protein Csa_008863 [Cucumis sativus]
MMKMAIGPSSPNILPSPQIFSIKSSHSSTLIFVKFKTFIHTIIFSQFCRLARAISRAKSTVVHILKKSYHYKDKNKNKIFFGSFRLHYNWCSSHVMPVPDPIWELGHFYYDHATSTAADGSQLSGYLQWLEERKLESETMTTATGTTAEMNEIDKLAEMFIASCHEKFRLEKQESARRFQAMMARSM